VCVCNKTVLVLIFPFSRSNSREGGQFKCSVIWAKCPTRVLKIHECISSVHQQLFKRSHVFCVSGTALCLCRYFEFPKDN
jgi:hypothetical protein